MTAGPTFRRATEADFEEVLPLLQQLWPAQELDEVRLCKAFCDGLASTEQVYLVAVVDDRVVSFGSPSIVNSLWVAGKLGHISELVVDEACRGQGVGTRLLEELLAVARERGCARAELDSAFHREAAHRFYESRGFQRRALWFSKPLT